MILENWRTSCVFLGEYIRVNLPSRNNEMNDTLIIS